MPTDYKAKLMSAVQDAKSRGWEVFSKDGVRFVTEHETPDNIPADWWSSATYNRITFLTFMLNGTRAPKVFIRDARSPWVESQDRSVSFKRAMEILAKGEHP